ncbi:hypothetical protein BU15DRAFT_77035 [Melanogaster broomeanus]|nr:hypothetical protein BU15DRAFT_77035 [Melanogaster broomeanus]
MFLLSTLLSTLSRHTRELREARVDSDYERVLTKLQAEWSFYRRFALAGLEAAVFGFSSGSLFTVDSIAKRGIAIGAIASGIGLSDRRVVFIGLQRMHTQQNSR